MESILAVSSDGRVDAVLHLLEERGPEAAAERDTEGRTALHLAAAAGHLDAVVALTLNGADVDAQDYVSCIHTAPHSHIVVYTIILTSTKTLPDTF